MHDGPTSVVDVAAEVAVVRPALDDKLARVREAFAGLDVDASLPLLGASGTTRVLGQLATPKNPLAPIPSGAVCAWRDRTLALSASDVLALDPEVLHGRADVYAAGLLILTAFLDRFGFDTVTPSPWGLRHGLALRWAAGRGRVV